MRALELAVHIPFHGVIYNYHMVCYMIYSYVLLHHVMGELEGRKNAWGYAEGGMGGVSQSIARAAKSYGATLHTDCVSTK